jgi:PAS domain S-box-containing protein
MELKGHLTSGSGITAFLDAKKERILSGRTELEVLEQSPLGVIKINRAGEITYANRKMLEIIDVGSYQGKTLQDIFTEAIWAKVEKRLKKRWRGKSDEYKTFMTRSDGRLVPVMISAVPEWNLKGEVCGSVALVRSLEVEHYIDKIHAEIENEPDHKKMLHAVARITAEIIPFDLFSAVVFSTSGQHLRQLFSYSPEGEQTQYRVRWWDVPKEFIKEMRQRQIVTRINGLQEYFSKAEWQKFKHQEVIHDFLAAGYRSRLLFNVIRSGRSLGAVGLYSKSKKPFSPKHEAILRSLPLDKAVNVACNLEEKKTTEFRLELMKKIAMACENIQEVGQIIVDGIADHYDLDIVSLFLVDDSHRLFRLMCQAGSKKLPEDYTQSLQEGVLSLVYAKNKHLEIGKNHDFNIPNVWENGAAKSVFKTAYDTVSKICLPIRTKAGFWVLNIEDPLENAFSKEEFEAIKSLRDEIAAFFSHSWLLHSLENTQASTSDAIISTNSLGNIKQVNPAAGHLLGYAMEDLIGTNLKKYFKDPETSEEALLEDDFPNREVVWQKRDGGDLRILLSGVQLPQFFDQRIFIAKDLSLQKKLEELEYLGKVSVELAMQIKTPLSLMFSWLNRLQAQAGDPSAAETLDKTVRQLKKVELTCDRLAVLGYEEPTGLIPYTPMSLDAQEIIRRLDEDLPRIELERIDFQVQENLPLFQGSLAQLAFCLESMISYLLRFLPENEKVQVAFSRRKQDLVVDVRGVFPEESLNGPAGVMDIALGTNIIRKFIEVDHKGRFFRSFDQKKQVLHFSIGLSMTSGEGHA